MWSEQRVVLVRVPIPSQLPLRYTILDFLVVVVVLVVAVSVGPPGGALSKLVVVLARVLLGRGRGTLCC